MTAAAWAARRRRPRPRARSPLAGALVGGCLPDRLAGAVRFPRGPAVQAGAGRLHGRGGRDHDRGSAGQAHRRPGRRRSSSPSWLLCCRGMLGTSTSPTLVLAPRCGPAPGLRTLLPRAPAAARRAAGTAVVAVFGLRGSGVRVVGRPVRAPHAGASGLSAGSAACCCPRARRRVRRLHRQRADRARLRRPARRPRSTPTGNCWPWARQPGAGLLRGFPVSSSGSRTAIGDARGDPAVLPGRAAVRWLSLLFAGPLLAALPAAALGASWSTPPSG